MSSEDIVTQEEVEADIETLNEHSGLPQKISDFHPRKSIFHERVMSIIADDAVGLTEIQFLAVNDHYEQLMKDNEENDSFKQFAHHMGFLLDKFRTSYSAQRRLKHKLAEQTIQLKMEAKGISDITGVLKERENEIASLMSKIENMKAMAEDIANQKNEALDNIASLNAEIHEMKDKAAAKASASTPEASSSRKQIMKLREEIISERTRLEAEITDLKNGLAEAVKLKTSNQFHLVDMTEKFKTCESSLLVCRNDLQLETKRKGKADRELIELRKELKEKVEVMKESSSELDRVKSQMDTLEIKSKKNEEGYYKYKQKLQDLTNAFEILKANFESRGEKLLVANAKREEIEKELDNKLNEIRGLKQELQSTKKQNHALAKQVVSLESISTTAEEKIELLQSETSSLAKDLENALEEHKKYRREIKGIRKDKELLISRVANGEKVIIQLTDEVMAKDDCIKVLDMQYSCTVLKLEKEEQKLKNCSLECDKSKEEALSLRRSLNKQKDGIVLLEKNARIFKKEVTGLEGKLKLERELLEQKTDSLFKCTKYLEETQYDVKKEKSKSASSVAYIDLMKSNVRDIEVRYATLSAEKNKVEIEIENSRREIGKANARVGECEVEISKKSQIIDNLTSNLNVMSKESDKLKKKLTLLTEDRNLFSTLATKKDEAINALKAEMKTLRADLIQSNQEVDCQAKDIQLLKSQLSKMSQSQVLLRKDADNMQVLRQELAESKQQLFKERLSNKAMETDINRPKNIHCMRFMPDTNPDKYDLLQKNVNLQRRLVKKDEELMVMSCELEEFKKNVENLQETLKKKPSVDVFKDLSYYRSKCRQLKDKCDSLTAQVNMYESCYSSFKDENALLKEKLNDIKTSTYIKQLYKRYAESKN